MSKVWWLPRSYILAAAPFRNPPEDVELARYCDLHFTPTPSGPQLYYTHCAVPNASAYVGFVCGPAASLLRCIVLLSSANYIA